MSAIESAYRRALRWYPASWRYRNEEALLGTLLDAAEAEGRQSPTSAVRRDLAVNGLIARGLELIPDSVRHRAASLALGVGAGLATIQFLGLEWAPWNAENARRPGPAPFPIDFGFGPLASLGAVVDLLWIAAFITAVLGWRLGTRIAAGASILVSAVIVLLPASPSIAARPPATGLLSMALLAMVAFIGDAGRSARSAGWVVITLALTIAGAAVILWLGFPSSHFPQPGFFGNRMFFTGLAPTWLAGILTAFILLFTALRQTAWVAAVLVGLFPWWLGMLANGTLQDPSEFIWVPMLAVIFVLGLALRGSGLRFRITRARTSSSDGSKPGSEGN